MPLSISCMPKPLPRRVGTTLSAGPLLPGEQQAIAARALPTDGKLARFLRQRPIFHGIGGELVQGHGENRGALRRQQHVRPLDHDPRPAFAVVGIHLALDHGFQARARPLRFEQEIVRAMQRLQALGQGLGHGLRGSGGRLAQARLHQRLHDGERVLDAVIELADQHRLALRRAPPLGHVAEDQHGAGQRAVEADDRRAAMLDRQFLLVAGDEQRARFEPRHRALAQRLQRRVVDAVCGCSRR